MRLEITDDNGMPLFTIYFKNLAEMPDVVVELFQKLEMPIQRLEFRVKAGGDWVGVKGTNDNQ